MNYYSFINYLVLSGYKNTCISIVEITHAKLRVELRVFLVVYVCVNYSQIRRRETELCARPEGYAPQQHLSAQSCFYRQKKPPDVNGVATKSI